MPTAAISIRELNRYLPKKLSAEQLEDYLEQLGCDIEGIATVKRYQCAHCGSYQEFTSSEALPGRCPDCLTEAEPTELWKFAGELEVIRMDLLPVRPDLFDAGGLARAIRGLMGEELGLPEYQLGDAGWQVSVSPSVDSESCYRPYIACAVIRGVQLDEYSLRSLMKLQENLHWALGRNRKLSSIGIYNLDTITPPISYRSVGRDQIKFVPLQSTDGIPLTPDEILEKHPKGVAYKHLLEEFREVPILIDARGQVLSMPPIINSEETKITEKTENFFIDVTGISDRTVEKTLNIVVSSILELFPGSRAERVKIEYDGRTESSPKFEIEERTISVSDAERLLGIKLPPERAAELLQKMRHGAKVVEPAEGKIAVQIPPYRNDIMHQVDLIEDIAIAYNYKNITPTLVPNLTVAKERPERLLSSLVRSAMTGLGFFETMSLLLSNREEQFELLGLEDPGTAVTVENPASVEQTMLRLSLLPQLLKLFAINRGQHLPQNLFEIDDVVKIEPGMDYPKEELHLAAGILDTDASFSKIKSVAEAVARELKLSLTYRAAEHPGMIPGRAAELSLDGKTIGILGEIHPAVLEKLRLAHPIAVFEIDLSPLLPDGWNKPLV